MFFAPERLAALLTAKWFFSGMNQHVSLQARRLEAANLAPGCHLAEVLTFVFPEFLAEPELATAGGTLVRPFTGVQKQMIAQQGWDPEPLSAQRTLVPQVAVVFPHVLVEQTVQPEGFAAFGARVRLDAGVHRKM